MGTKASAPAPQVGATIPNAAAATAAPKFSFEAAEAQMTPMTSLSVEGKAYVARLAELFAKTGEIIVEQVPYRMETIACINQNAKQAILLIFQESYIGGSASQLPVTEYMPDIHSAFKNKHEDIAMLEYVVVMKEDYSRVENMAIFISNAFKAVNPNLALTADMFQNMKLTPTTDLKQVKAFIDAHSPHAVQERADWGILINRVLNSSRVDSYTSIKEPELRPIAAIAGYTKFLQIYAQGFRKYLPVCVITNVTCTVPSTDILALALPITAGCVISQRQWERPYTTFGKDKPNLGRLIIDPTAKSLKWFANLEEMHMEMAKYIIEVPLLALDCAEGRARIPGLEKYVISGAQAITEQLTSFFGPAKASTFLATNQSPIMTTFFNFEGVYKTGGALVDTRNGDYINMVTETKDYSRCQRALAQSMTPGSHLQDIAAIYGEDVVTPLYRVHTIVFNSLLINVLAQLVVEIVKYNSETCVNQNVDMAALLAQFNTAIGGNNAIFGAFGGTLTPGNLYR